MILCDTNIFIELYKGNPSIVEALRDIGPSNLAISVITIGELYFGAKDKRELRKIQGHLSMLQQIMLDEDISNIFITLLGNYALSHKLSVPDGLLAATALRYGLSLYTLNTKDFRYIPELPLYKP